MSFGDVSVVKRHEARLCKQPKELSRLCSGGIWFEPWQGYCPPGLTLLFVFTYFLERNEGLKQVTTTSGLMFAYSPSSCF